jgi:hypothetical protein
MLLTALLPGCAETHRRTQATTNAQGATTAGQSGLGEGTPLGRIRADRPRPDVNRITGHEGHHGFEFPLPPTARGGGHTLSVYGLDPATGDRWELPGSPCQVP